MGKTRRLRVKDPYRHEVVTARLNARRNLEPQSLEQEVPKYLQAIAKFNKPKKTPDESDVTKVNTKGKKKQVVGSKNRKRKGKKRHTNSLLPDLQQHPNESDQKFLKRAHMMTQIVLREAALKDKYKVEGLRGTHQGNTNPQLSQKRKPTRRAEKSKLAKKERVLRKKLKHMEKEEDEFTYYQDKIEFGEVVDEPPSLDTTKLTRKVNNGVGKPKSFLFMDKLKNEASSDAPKEVQQMKSYAATRKRTLEAERIKAVNAYRKMKAARPHAVTLSEFT
ncbi:hypothetical protein Pcinc_017141 [Petrolisthes cinctipes]|uniref:Coiled-coil domain-containing protein 137 n=1 Tax=Petrolisthes cinctipes TaxID=88211 RepID=A0AAE1FS37_PETCI|nr:hypothetical protein Pcinc_017141 [Petrolisthes cinctipes]